MKNTRLLALVLLIITGVAAIYRFWDVVMLFFLAGIIAFLLAPIARLLTFGGRIPRGLAVAVTVLGVVGLITWLVVLFVPYAVEQISGLVDDLMRYAGSFDQLLAQLEDLLASWHVPQEVLDWVTNLIGKADVYLARAATTLLSWLMNTTTGIFDLVVVMILIVYFMVDGMKMLRAGVQLLPKRMGLRVKRVLAESNHYIWKYLGTRVLISLGMAVVSYIGFSIIGLRYALLFACLAFVMDFIPYFGSMIAGVVDGIFALITGGVGLAVEVVIFVLVVQQIEGNVVAPKLQGKSVNIHPVWVMFSLLACSEIWGPVGMLISTPVAAVVKTALREVYYYIIGDDTLGGRHMPADPPDSPDTESGEPASLPDAPAEEPAPAEDAAPAAEPASGPAAPAK